MSVQPATCINKLSKPCVFQLQLVKQSTLPECSVQIKPFLTYAIKKKTKLIKTWCFV